MYYVPMYPPPYYPMTPIYDYRGMPYEQGNAQPYYHQAQPVDYSMMDQEYGRHSVEEERKRQSIDQGYERRSVEQERKRQSTDQGYEWQSAEQAHQRQSMDQGSEGYVVNIRNMARENNTFRTAVWTGNHLQVTVMRIPVGEDIGLEVHPDGDQFIRIEEGEGIVRMGNMKNNLNMEQSVYGGYAIMIPAGKWHNVINTGNRPLKLYTIYAPPEHPYGTVHNTKQEAMAAENYY